MDNPIVYFLLFSDSLLCFLPNRSPSLHLRCNLIMCFTETTWGLLQWQPISSSVAKIFHYILIHFICYEEWNIVLFFNHFIHARKWLTWYDNGFLNLPLNIISFRCGHCMSYLLRHYFDFRYFQMRFLKTFGHIKPWNLAYQTVY